MTPIRLVETGWKVRGCKGLQVGPNMGITLLLNGRQAIDKGIFYNLIGLEVRSLVEAVAYV